MSEKGPKSKDPSNNGGLVKASDINIQLDNVVNVPIAIMKRVNSLKNVQVKLLEIESKFFEELHLLECKYSTLYEPLYEKRKQIVNGEYEPTEDESKWALDDDLDLTTDSENKAVGDASKTTPASTTTPATTGGEAAGEGGDLAKDLKSKANLSDIGSGAIDVKGVPDFWLQTFKSVELISDMIQEYDEPVLKHLYDVKVKLHDQKPYGYTLEFYFNENEYFTNAVLTKSYELRTEIDAKDPFSYEGPDLYKCKGCTIDWKKGKNVTVRLIKKKQKHKGHGTVRVISKEIKQDSFFNYFDTLEGGAGEEAKTPVSSSAEDSKTKAKADTSKSEHDDDDDELKDEGLLAADFEIGHFFKERIIPKAVLYFTGEIADDEYDEYDDEDEDDEDLDDDDDGSDHDDDDDDDDGGHNRRPHRRHDDSKSNDDESKKPHGGKGGKGGKGGAKHSDPHNKNNPPECKQN